MTRSTIMPSRALTHIAHRALTRIAHVCKFRTSILILYSRVVVVMILLQGMPEEGERSESPLVTF